MSRFDRIIEALEVAAIMTMFWLALLFAGLWMIFTAISEPYPLISLDAFINITLALYAISLLQIICAELKNKPKKRV